MIPVDLWILSHVSAGENEGSERCWVTTKIKLLDFGLSGFNFYFLSVDSTLLHLMSNQSIKASDVLIVKEKAVDRTLELEVLMGRVSTCLLLAGSSSLSSSVFLLNVRMMFDTSADTFTHLHFYTDASDAEEKLLTAVVAASNLHVTNI